MSRPAVVAAFIAGAALVATVMVMSDPASPLENEHTLAQKLSMLKHVKGHNAAYAHKNYYLQSLDTLCETKVQDNGQCPGEAAEYIFQDGCC